MNYGSSSNEFDCVAYNEQILEEDNEADTLGCLQYEATANQDVVHGGSVLGRKYKPRDRKVSNTATLIPQKLTGPNYSMWTSQMNNLFLGYDLMGYIDGTILCPQATTSEYKVWVRQDRLLLLAIQTTVQGSTGPLITRCATTYANKSNTRTVSLIDAFTKIHQEGKTISEYLQPVKTIIDDLTAIGHNMSDGEIVVHTLNGLPNSYKEIKAALRAQETLISFDELMKKLLDYETSFKHSIVAPEDTSITAHFFQKQPYKRANFILLNLDNHHMKVMLPSFVGPDLHRSTGHKQTSQPAPPRAIIRDLITRASLVRGQSKDNVYEWPTSITDSSQTISSLAYTAIKSNFLSPSTHLWHSRLGYPYFMVDREPSSTYKQALQNPMWRQAMCDEYNVLLSNKTCSLVPRTVTQNIIGCKWVYKIKRNPDGSIARLVAKGFNQRLGIDFSETYGPVVKHATVRLILTLAVTNGWPLRQLDVNNAFLQGSLSDEVFMDQPPDFINTDFPHHFCKITKAIYGLRQAPRAWYQELPNFLLSTGFITSPSDTSLFMYLRSGYNVYLLIYVDDTIITGSCVTDVIEFITLLSRHFSLKDLGLLSYFLGIEAIQVVMDYFCPNENIFPTF
ncbi:PREDICTED: uncharacterized protein LOC105954894 [Erythranthe guttata]|uniref:uncharacterized protein LOC105954894 n=1 Tax=Erythranthe guttata TaxID=4155 RepID=UPI00064DEA43|nr:PREDICTED: uncharacterized protein LOC105954894 [Erythranthe guttata]|eukprot:XP_012834032.1 PREDICTED: uncharacterized protein LOC105954894 [Erythranthe guttata]